MLKAPIKGSSRAWNALTFLAHEARNVKLRRLERVFDRADRVHTGGFLESIQAAGAVAATERQSDPWTRYGVTVRPPRPAVLNLIHVLRESRWRKVRATRGADAQRN